MGSLELRPSFKLMAICPCRASDISSSIEVIVHQHPIETSEESGVELARNARRGIGTVLPLSYHEVDEELLAMAGGRSVVSVQRDLPGNGTIGPQ